MELIKTSPKSGLGIYAKSLPIYKFSEWRVAKTESKKLEKWLDEVNGNFQGEHNSAYAIAHCQVALVPLAFFTVAKEIADEFFNGHRSIFNPEILEKKVKITKNLPVPRTADNGSKIVNDMQDMEVYNIFNWLEGCMSFPHRTAKYVARYHTIKVRYQYINMLGLVDTWTGEIEGLAAHIFQHEFDHIEGRNIFFTT